MINNNINQVKHAVTSQTEKLDTGARKARDEMMATLIQLAMEEIKGERPYTTSSSGKTRYYSKATTGEPPMNRTGNLRRSIKGEKEKVGFAHYTAIVGPTMKYARAVELGGKYAPKTWRNGEHFPYMKPAFNKFQKIAMSIVHKHLG